MRTGGGKSIANRRRFCRKPAEVRDKSATQTSRFPARPYITPAGEKGLEYMRKVVREGIK